MLNPFMSCIAWASEMLIFYIFFSKIAKPKFSTLKTILIGLVLSQFASVVNLLSHNNTNLNLAVTLFIRYPYAIFCFDTKSIRAVFYSFIFELLNIALELAVISIFSVLLHVPSTAYNENFPLLIAEISSCRTLLLLSCLALSSIIHHDTDTATFPISLFISPLTAVACIVLFAYAISLEIIAPSVQIALSITCVFIFISTICQVIGYQHQTEVEQEQLRQKRELERLQTEKAYYDILSQQNQQLMMFAHDAKNHLAAIQALKPDQNISGYAEKLSDQLDNYTRNCHSGNMLLDVMVNKYVMECKRLGIEFEYNVKLGNLKELSELDLVAVLGNLMDNAVTAAGQSSEKKISLETSRRNSYAVLVIRNSCDTAPREKGGHLLTSKKEPSHHGFGLKSAMKTLKNYQGDLHWNYDDSRHVFTMTAMIWSPLDEKVVYS